MTIEIHLDKFSGPLDLLLHLIKSNEMDIYDIRIGEITEQYLEIIERMKQLDLDIAGEFLLMASTLIHIKSRMLLPASDEVDEEEGEDPREELIKRLLEYQRYKEVAELFQQMPQLERDVFKGSFEASDLIEDEEDAQIAIGIYQLAEAFHRIVQNRPREIFHEVVQETLSVATHVEMIVDLLRTKSRRRLMECLPGHFSRPQLVVTFLATLELVKMRMINVEQVDAFSDVWLSVAVPLEQLTSALLVGSELNYG